MSKQKILDADELVDAYIDSRRFHLEGSTADLETLVGILNPDYTDIEAFLCDNPGAQEAIVDWIRKYVPRVEEWESNLRNEIDD